MKVLIEEVDLYFTTLERQKIIELIHISKYTVNVANISCICMQLRHPDAGGSYIGVQDLYKQRHAASQGKDFISELGY